MAKTRSATTPKKRKFEETNGHLSLEAQAQQTYGKVHTPVESSAKTHYQSDPHSQPLVNGSGGATSKRRPPSYYARLARKAADRGLPPPPDPYQSKETNSAASAATPRRLPHDVPLEERLKEISGPSKRSKNAIGTDGESLVVLLTQGLHSEDDQKIETALSKADLRSITATVKQLPVQLVLPLIRQLHKRIRIKTTIKPLLTWFQCTLSTHLSYISSEQLTFVDKLQQKHTEALKLPDVRQELVDMQQWLHSRAAATDNLLRLRGRLRLLLEQTTRRTDNTDTPMAQRPLICFQEESSGDESNQDKAFNFDNNGSEGSGSAPTPKSALKSDWWDEMDQADAGSGDDFSAEENNAQDSDDNEESPSGSSDEGGEIAPSATKRKMPGASSSSSEGEESD